MLRESECRHEGNAAQFDRGHRGRAAVMTVSTLYIAWRVKEIYDAIPEEPINVTIEPKKQ
jgi:hypothetical protein